MKVTRKGSILLFFLIKRHLTEQIAKTGIKVKVTATSIGEHMGFDPVKSSNWARGRFVVNKIDEFMKISQLTNTSIDILYKILTPFCFYILCGR